MSDIKTIIFEAGNIIKSSYYTSFKFRSKQKFDLVSEVDFEIEELLVSRLKEKYPEHGIFSEETGDIKNSREYKWIIDPIDGTTNFIFGIPYFSISLSLEQKGEVVESYIYNPISDEFFYSIDSEKKSYLNENEIFVSETDIIENALVTFGFSTNYANINKYYSNWSNIFDNCQKGLGALSPALNICNVARGRTDCFIDFGSSMEGHAGAGLILKNAGGMVLNYDLTPWEYKTKGIIATNNKLLPSIIELRR